MRDLIVVGFEGKHRASEVLGQLQGLNDESLIDLGDAVAAYRTDDGKLRVDQSVEPTGKEGGVGGAIIGSLLGMVIAAPFTAGISAAAAAAAVGASAIGLGTIGAAAGDNEASTWKEKYGVSDDFVKQVGGMLQPGESAVFAVIQSADPVAVAERFRGYGGKVLRTTLTPEQASTVQRTIAAQREATR
jgi:uncharacterized membrane protein